MVAKVSATVLVVISHLIRVRRWLGCWIRERVSTELALAQTRIYKSNAWCRISNRNEVVVLGSTHDAMECKWRDSSWLTVTNVFPKVGGRLLRACWNGFFEKSSNLGATSGDVAIPSVSVIIPICGQERLAQLSQVIKSFQRAENQPSELIIVGPEAEISSLDHSCSLIRKVCLEKKHHDDEFNKSAALNIGVQNAHSEVLIFHDGDVVVPDKYVTTVAERLSEKYEFIQPIRFLFCLSERETDSYIKSGGQLQLKKVSEVMQNFPGGSIGIKKAAFHKIGGFDETFTGWGGEDLEFLDRARTLNSFRGHYAPAIHLWHPPAQKKESGNRNQVTLDQKRQIPVEHRIRNLVNGQN